MDFLPFPDVPAVAGVPPLLGQLSSAGDGVARLAGFSATIAGNVGVQQAAIAGLPPLVAAITPQMAAASAAISVALPGALGVSLSGRLDGMSLGLTASMGRVPGMIGTLDGVTTAVVGFPSTLIGGRVALDGISQVSSSLSGMLALHASIQGGIGEIGGTLTASIGAAASPILNQLGGITLGVSGLASVTGSIRVGMDGLGVSVTGMIGGGATITSLFGTSASPVLADSPATEDPRDAGKWGIYTRDGKPVLTGDATLSGDWRLEYRISDHPIEEGAFASYNKVQTPFDFRLTFACDGSGGGALGAALQHPTRANRTTFLQAVEREAASLTLYTVVTPERFYPSANITHADYRREGHSGATLIKVDVWLQEVRVTATTAFSQTKTAEGAATQDNGDTQPKVPTKKELAGAEGAKTTGLPPSQIFGSGDTGGSGGLPPSQLLGGAQPADAPFHTDLTPPGKGAGTSFTGETANPIAAGSVDDYGRPVPLLGAPFNPPPPPTFGPPPPPFFGPRMDTSTAQLMSLS
jgi:hypothetical protein